MKDRVAGAPGQYKATITESDLQKMQAGEQFVITMARDDQPIVEGTPYSKAAVLPDDVAEMICPGIEDPTPAEAFRHLVERANASAGFGLGRAKNITVAELGSTTAPGWYCIDNEKMTFNAVSSNYWYLHVKAYTDGARHCRQTLYSVDGVVELVRCRYNDTWTEWEWVNPPMTIGQTYRTTERIDGKAVIKSKNSNGQLQYLLDGETEWKDYIGFLGAAPAGFGLGRAKNITVGELGSTTAPGWYFIDNEKMTFNAASSNYWYLHVKAYTDGARHCRQTLYSVDGVVELVRCRYNDTWTEWEWVNPPVKIGQTYRTTERYNEKPVYIKLVDCGNAPNNTNKAVAYAEEGTVIPIDCRGQIVSMDANGTIYGEYLDDSYTYGAVKGKTLAVNAYTHRVVITTSFDASTNTVLACVKFIMK